MILEIQALMSPAAYASPLRMTQGIDRMRLSMLLAVLEKAVRCGTGNMDAYVNVTGGIRIRETAADLAILAAIMSSIQERSVSPELMIMGEVGLTGEIRPIAQADKRIAEALRMGWQRFILPAGCEKQIKNSKIRITGDLYYVGKVSEALDLLFI